MPDKIRHQRVAEVIAQRLRDQIVAGQLDGNSELPPQDDLADQFGVSRVAVREALGILHSEGLITIRRGKQGGAIVHPPSIDLAAEMMGLVFHYRDVSLSDLSRALMLIEPVCAGLCAKREDRHDSVIPQLTSILEETKERVEDAVEFTRLSREFHECLVQTCGNEALILVVGTLERLWSEAEQDWAQRAAEAGEFPQLAERREGIRAHAKILELISDGRVEGTERVCRKHLELGQRYTLAEDQ